MKNQPVIRQFGLEVKRRRIALGITQEEFAELSGIHRTYISGIERGERNPTIDLIIVIARALKCQPADIMPKVGHAAL